MVIFLLLQQLQYDFASTAGEMEHGSTYQWYRSDDTSGTNRAAISGATGRYYVNTVDDVAKYIDCEVTPASTNSTGSATTLGYSAVIADVADEFKFTINIANDGDSFTFTPTGFSSTSVNYGDGTTETDTHTHAYASAGSYQIAIDGAMTDISFDSTNALLVTSLDNIGNTGLNNQLRSLLRGNTNLTSVSLSGDLSAVTSMQEAFENTTGVNSAFDFAGLHMPLCTNIYQWINSSTATSVDLSYSIFASTELNYLASNLTAATSINLDGVVTDTITSLAYMIIGAPFATSISIKNWDVRSVANMASFGYGNTHVTALDFTPYINKMPVCKNYYRMLYNNTACTSSMPEEVFWNNPSEPESYNQCFTNDTNISNYSSIPSAWGGGGS